MTTWLRLHFAVTGAEVLVRAESIILARPGPFVPTIEGDKIETTRVQLDIVGEYIDVRETAGEIGDLIDRQVDDA